MNTPKAGLGDLDDGSMGAIAAAPTQAQRNSGVKKGPRNPPPRSQSLQEQAEAAAADSDVDTNDVDDLDARIERLQTIKAQKTGIARPSLREPLRQSFHDDLSDADIMRMYEAEDADQFYIDLTVVPDHLVYEWKRLEVYGKDDKGYEAELARRGWVPVQADSHVGYFMPKSYHGPVIRGGQGLFAMPAVEYQRRARYQQLKARQQVEDQERVLGIAPTVGGVPTGPREHARVRPKVDKTYEAVDEA